MMNNFTGIGQLPVLSIENFFVGISDLPVIRDPDEARVITIQEEIGKLGDNDLAILTEAYARAFAISDKLEITIKGTIEAGLETARTAPQLLVEFEKKSPELNINSLEALRELRKVFDSTHNLLSTEGGIDLFEALNRELFARGIHIPIRQIRIIDASKALFEIEETFIGSTPQRGISLPLLDLSVTFNEDIRQAQAIEGDVRRILELTQTLSGIQLGVLALTSSTLFVWPAWLLIVIASGAGAFALIAVPTAISLTIAGVKIGEFIGKFFESIGPFIPAIIIGSIIVTAAVVILPIILSPRE